MKWLFGGVAATLLAMLAKRRSEETEEEAPPIPSVPTGPVIQPVRTEVPAERPGVHWTWPELSVSATAVRLGLDNTPTPQARANLRFTVREVLDPLRGRFGRSVRVNSAYRSPTVNRAVGGVASSHHLTGLAVDIALPRAHWPSVISDLRRRGFRVIEYRNHLHVEAPKGPTVGVT